MHLEGGGGAKGAFFPLTILPPHEEISKYSTVIEEHLFSVDTVCTTYFIAKCLWEVYSCAEHAPHLFPETVLLKPPVVCVCSGEGPAAQGGGTTSIASCQYFGGEANLTRSEALW